MLLVVLSSCSVQGIQPHEHFDEASEDLYAIVAFLADTMQLCKESLEYSLLVNCTILFNETVTLYYSSEWLQASYEKSEEIQQRLLYPSDVADTMKGKAGSYEHLKDFLYPLKELGINVTSFVYHHQNIISNLLIIVDFISEGGNKTKAVESFIDAQSAIQRARATLQDSETNSETLSDVFATDELQNLSYELQVKLDTYDSYLATLVTLLESDEPVLYIYVADDDLYLDESVHIFGFFMAERAFIANTSVTIYWDDQVIGHVITDSYGRFGYSISMLLSYSPSVHTVVASTPYHHTLHFSNHVSILLRKIPTQVSISTGKSHYYLNEIIMFYGDLIDYKKRGIPASLELYLAGLNFSLNTSENGSYQYTFNQSLPFGVYPACVAFTPEQIYESCQSPSITVHIDTPTSLSLSASAQDLIIGDELLLHGQLTNAISYTPLSNKTIVIYLNDKAIGFRLTNGSGFFNVSVTTKSFNAGEYRLYAQFISDGVELRSSTSRIITVQFYLGLVESLFPFVPIFIIIIGLIGIAVLFVFRRRISSLLVKKKPISQPITPSSSMSSIPLPENIQFNKDEFTIDISKRTSDFKDTIISKYRLLLQFLTSRGITITPSHTHLDVQQSLIRQGVPKRATDTITHAFELAQYSPYHIKKHEIALFNAHIKIIIHSVGG